LDLAPVSSPPCWDVNSSSPWPTSGTLLTMGLGCWISAQAKEHTDKPQCHWGDVHFGAIEQPAVIVTLLLPRILCPCPPYHHHCCHCCLCQSTRLWTYQVQKKRGLVTNILSAEQRRHVRTGVVKANSEQGQQTQEEQQWWGRGILHLVFCDLCAFFVSSLAPQWLSCAGLLNLNYL
jgi:hypothetical protein